MDTKTLGTWANEVREKFAGNSFDICTIINGKSGKCSENCKFCAQSAFYKTGAEEYPLLDNEAIVKDAVDNEEQGILRYSVVTSGRNLNDEEVDKLCYIYENVGKASDISLCSSNGLLSYEQFVKLRQSGVTRYHNNLETSQNYFHKICTSHSYEDKILAIKNAQKAGLQVCSGGIFGFGESREDRIDMAFTLKELGIKSIPLNMFTAIKGTPFENLHIDNDEFVKCVAIYRLIMPDAVIRIAAGRARYKDKGRQLFLSGSNGAISGNMLTTAGIKTEDDIKLIKELGFKIERI